MEKFILTKPIENNGEVIKELNLNLDDLTARQLMSAEKEARLLLGKQAVQTMSVPELNKTYLCCIAAKASNIGVNTIMELKANDYSRLTMLIQDFLLADNVEEMVEI